MTNSSFVYLQEDYIDPEDDTDDNYIDPTVKGPANKMLKLLKCYM